MEFFAGGRVAVSAIPQALMEQLQLTEDDVDVKKGAKELLDEVEGML